MFLIMPATRNNVITLLLGIPFDSLVVHHRFLGRFAIGMSVLHCAWYFKRMSSRLDEHIYLTGLGALICGLVIVATTFDWVRRRWFNVFYWAHYSFVGFFVLTYIHSRQARPFLLVGIGLYAVDKLLRLLWTALPCKTLVFRNRGENIAQVQFPKNRLTELVHKHKVGQYMFVNFPELSWTEWHPFSVTSGPTEPHIELHIRNLGDHTRKIVALSKKCADEGRSTWIRRDGPYGHLDFDYRRYGVLVLVGGGVGIAPIIGILKDIYTRSEAETDNNKLPVPHAIECVNVVWVVRHPAEALTFMGVLNEHVRISEQRTGVNSEGTWKRPELRLKIHCTRTEEAVQPPLVRGRPDFAKVLDEITASYESEPTLVFACGPRGMVNMLWDESCKRTSRKRPVHFHHETFEF
jgi:NAD(P)H-flavin reductase